MTRRKFEWEGKFTEEDRQTIEWLINYKRFELRKQLPETEEAAKTRHETYQKLFNAQVSMAMLREIQ